MFYHIKNLQSTKTGIMERHLTKQFYHIKNLQSTKTVICKQLNITSFITLRIYKVLKRLAKRSLHTFVLSH